MGHPKSICLNGEETEVSSATKNGDEDTFQTQDQPERETLDTLEAKNHESNFQPQTTSRGTSPSNLRQIEIERRQESRAQAEGTDDNDK